MAIIGLRKWMFGAALILPSAISYTTLAAVTLVTMSGGNLVGTHSGTGNALARSAATKSAGKFYVEFVATDWGQTGDGVGVCTSAATATDVASTGINCSIVYRSGNIWSNGASTGKSLGAVADGDRIDVAADFDNLKFWVRKNGGNWNNDALANPATNTGGVTMIATAMAPCLSFGAVNNTQVTTCNMGATAFVGTPPSGFTVGWPN